MKKWQLILIHISYWLIFIFNQIPKVGRINFIEIDYLWFSFLVVNIGAFYFNYFVVLPEVVNKKRIPVIVGLLASFFIFILLRFSVEEVFFPKIIGHGNYKEGTGTLFYIYDNLYYGSSAVFISSLIWFLDFALQKQHENEQLLKEKKSAEVSLLKSQINPHFIFNTLNNIYSLVNMKSEKSLPAIEKLGDLLRISASEIHKDFIPLKTEIQYLKSVVDLESLRLKNPEIVFDEKITNADLKIAPMILIPFVENAFKHGDINNFPLYILIQDENKMLKFSVKNKISQGRKDHSTGIGIENVRKRLELIYPGKHSFEIVKNDGFFEVQLKIFLA